MKAALRCAGVALAVTLVANHAFAHRLDEYLQGSILSVEKNRLEVQLTMTPGVAVFPFLIATMDTDADGAISETEQKAYARQVLRDLTLAIDGNRLEARLVSVRFPPVAEMKEGRGEIRLDFSAELPSGGRNRKLSLQNRHEAGISAYQVNCLVPRDSSIRIVAQNRNYSQSRYELNYEQTDVAPDSLASLWLGRMLWLSPGAILMTWFARRRLTIRC